MRSPLFLISLALSSAACSSQVDESADAEASASNGYQATAKAEEAPGGVDFVDSSSDGGTREFRYSWPGEVSAIPELARQLETERGRALAEQTGDWEEMKATAPEDCVSCRSRGFEKVWKVVADLPGYLSLSADLSLYTGGAHGTYGRTSLVWDRENARSLEGIELFASPVALETALGAKLCDTLDAQREKRRGIPVREGGGLFDECPGLDEAAVFVGSSNGTHFDRIGVYFGPYVAGPYAEGAYELNFPVTASVLDAVKPEYANAFRVKR